MTGSQTLREHHARSGQVFPYPAQRPCLSAETAWAAPRKAGSQGRNPSFPARLSLSPRARRRRRGAAPARPRSAPRTAPRGDRRRCRDMLPRCRGAARPARRAHTSHTDLTHTHTPLTHTHTQPHTLTHRGASVTHHILRRAPRRRRRRRRPPPPAPRTPLSARRRWRRAAAAPCGGQRRRLAWPGRPAEAAAAAQLQSGRAGSRGHMVLPAAPPAARPLRTAPPPAARAPRTARGCRQGTQKRGARPCVSHSASFPPSPPPFSFASVVCHARRMVLS